MWRPTMWPRCRCWRASIWAIATGSSRCRRRARRAAGSRPGGGARRAAAAPSTTPATSPARCPRRSMTLVAQPPRLPRRVEVVAYCRGPYCVYADDAVRLLRDRGVPRAPARRRLPRVAAGRDCPSRSPQGERPDAAAPVPERRHLVCQLPVRVHDARACWRWSTRTPTWSMDTSPRPRPWDSRSWPCSRPTSRPITSRACPSWSSAPARRRICRPAPASSSSTSRSTTAPWSSSGTRG